MISDEYVEGEAIVKLKSSANTATPSVEGVSYEMLFGFPTKETAQMKNNMETQPPQFALARANGLSTEQLVSALESDPNVEYVEPNYIYQLGALMEESEDTTTQVKDFNNLPKNSMILSQNTSDIVLTNNTINTATSYNRPNDPYLGLQWTLDTSRKQSPGSVQVDEIWNNTTGNKDLIVAVLDSGIDVNHPDLKANIRTDLSYNALDGSNDITDFNGHGTHVAGIIGAIGNNGMGISGINQKVSLMGVSVSLPDGFVSASALVKGCNYVYQKKLSGHNIVAANLSIATATTSLSQREAVQALASVGVTPILAAGNEFVNLDVIPNSPGASFGKNIITVNALDQNGALWEGSNFGKANTQLMAPGVRILSTFPVEKARTGDPDADALLRDDLTKYPNSDFDMGYSGVGKLYRSTDNQSMIWDFEDKSNDSSKVQQGVIQNNKPLDLSKRDKKRPVFITIPIKNIVFTNSTLPYKITAYVTNTKGIYEQVGRTEMIMPDQINLPISIRLESDAQVDWSNISFKFVLTRNENGAEMLNGQIILGAAVATQEALPYFIASGTSMATPTVTGSVALLQAAYPNESPERIAARIIGGVTRTPELENLSISGGYLDLAKAKDPYPVLWEISQEGDTVTLVGEFFGYNAGSLQLDGKTIPTTSWSDQKIVFTRPIGMKTKLCEIMVTRSLDKSYGSRCLELTGLASSDYETLPSIDYEALGVQSSSDSNRPGGIVAIGGSLYTNTQEPYTSKGGKTAYQLLQYDITSKSWKIAARSSTPKKHLAISAIGHRIYIMLDGDKANTLDVMVYNTLTKTMNKHRKIKIPNSWQLSNANYTADGENVWIVNKTTVKDKEVSNVYQVNLYTGKTKSMSNLSNVRFSPVLLTNGDKALALGGYESHPSIFVPGAENFDGKRWLPAKMPNIYEGQHLRFATGRINDGYLVVGAQNAEKDLRNLWHYNINTGAWRALNKQIGVSKLFEPTGTAYNNSFFVLAIKTIGVDHQTVFYRFPTKTDKVPYRLVAESKAHGSIKVPDNLTQGKNISIVVKPEKGYVLDTLRLNGVLVSKKELKMPPQHSVLEATFRLK